MTGYNSQVGGGKYCIQYETDSRENYREVEELIRRQIDGKTVDVPDTNVGEWIPCSERLPNNTDNVLITTQYGVILTVFRGMSGKWCYLDGRRLDSQDTPVAWMPLPEPYKGVE